ncbi:hypothetical protein BB561_000553 [Smittium simulii]|uniref:Uncharacterized protein n=1 Tax=Smittium simulii TaxID=133385 RepID=A0A2T9YYL9_9FUNG|nr:hypothetical protein BB561_000553 [Smittium simulii]
MDKDIDSKSDSILEPKIYNHLFDTSTSEPTLINIWEVQELEESDYFINYYSKRKICFVFVFDLCDKSTYYVMRSWIKTYKKTLFNNKIPVVVIGNKVDKHKEREVDSHLISSVNKKLINQNLIFAYFETSAKFSINIKESIQCAVALAKIDKNTIIQSCLPLVPNKTNNKIMFSSKMYKKIILIAKKKFRHFFNSTNSNKK